MLCLVPELGTILIGANNFIVAYIHPTNASCPTLLTSPSWSMFHLANNNVFSTMKEPSFETYEECIYKEQKRQEAEIFSSLNADHGYSMEKETKRSTGVKVLSKCNFSNSLIVVLFVQK